MRKQSSAHQAAHSSSDYVVHWPAVVGASGLVVLLLLGVGLWGRVEQVQQRRQAAADEGAMTSADSMPAPRMTTCKPLALRRDGGGSGPPRFVAAERQPRSGGAVVTAQSLLASSSEAAQLALAQRASNAGVLWSLLERQITMPDAPAEVVRRSEPKPVPATVAAERWNKDAHEALIDYLVNDVRELDVNDDNDTAKYLFQASSTQNASSQDLHAAMLYEISRTHAELFGLPLLDAADCQAEPDIARKRSKLSTDMRRNFLLGSEQYTYEKFQSLYARTKGNKTQTDVNDESSDPYYEPTMDEVAKFVHEIFSGKMTAMDDAEQVAILEQMLQCEEPFYRRFLIHLLEKIDDPRASQAMARRAVFDMNPEIRRAASQALLKRPPNHYADVLMRGIDYPWALVSQHAAEAIAFLDSNESNDARPATDKDFASADPTLPVAGSRYGELVDALQRGQKYESSRDPWRAALDPGSNKLAPHFDRREGWVVREMVKVNHLRNCVLCHPASNATSDPLRGQIPTPGQPLPPVYYSGKKGDFVRADVVYLRQDFSVMLPVNDHGKWPKMQRFDFFITTRPATAEEMADAEVQRIQTEAAAREQAIDSVRAAVIEFVRKAYHVVDGMSRSDPPSS